VNAYRRVRATIVAAAMLADGAASATTGPVQAPLRITAMYTVQGQGVVYVQFQTGAMPGCYANAGGYLWTTNSAYKELQAQLTTILATGGVRASVVFTVNAQTNNWGDCTIDGLYLMP
jgi:hypothetical protein